jgi:hypothetical protein
LFGGARFGCCKQSLASPWRGLEVLGQAVSARTIQIGGTAPMKAAPEHVARIEQLTIDLYQREALKSRVPAGRCCRPVLTDEVIEETLAAVVHESVPAGNGHAGAVTASPL